MRVLFVTLGAPVPPDSGARIRDYHLIRHVARQHATGVLSLLRTPQEIGPLARLSEFCELVDHEVLAPRAARELPASLVRHAAGRWPLATLPYHRAAAERALRSAIERFEPDIVQVEHFFLTRYLDALPPDGSVRSVLSFHNVGALQYRSMMRMAGGPLRRASYLAKWLLMLGWEARDAGRFDHVIAVSREEAAFLRARNPDLEVSIVPNGVDTGALRPLPDDGTEPVLLFVGNFRYPPNCDAVLHFCRTALPRIRAQVPDARLVVVGQDPPPALRRLGQDPGVRVTGSVPDVTSYYRRARVCVVPLRAGGGTRLKILEAMALGRPVVSTALGSEGLDVISGRHLLLADDPDALAAAVVGLLREAPLRRRLAAEARRLAESVYDWEVVGRSLVSAYEDIARRRAA